MQFNVNPLLHELFFCRFLRCNLRETPINYRLIDTELIGIFSMIHSHFRNKIFVKCCSWTTQCNISNIINFGRNLVLRIFFCKFAVSLQLMVKEILSTVLLWSEISSFLSNFPIVKWLLIFCYRDGIQIPCLMHMHLAYKRTRVCVCVHDLQ